MRIVLSESQLNTLVENTKTVFKDEDKLKQEVESHISEDADKNVVVDVSKKNVNVDLTVKNVIVVKKKRKPRRIGIRMIQSATQI